MHSAHKQNYLWCSSLEDSLLPQCVQRKLGAPNQVMNWSSSRWSRNASIFACDKAEVYGDTEVSLGGGVMVQKVEDVETDFHFAKRKHAGTWINTGVYKQIWKALGKKATFASHDWTVKGSILPPCNTTMFGNEIYSISSCICGAHMLVKSAEKMSGESSYYCCWWAD